MRQDVRRGSMKWFRNRRLWGRYSRLRPTVQRKLRIAVPYFVAGVATLLVTFIFFDPPIWALWALFTALFVLLEFFAVEVNDRLMQSASVMVIMTAGVIFALEPGTDATFGMALMAAMYAAVGPRLDRDICGRRTKV